MLLILNLKMNLSRDNIIGYEKYIHNKNVIVLPQYPYIPFFRDGIYKIGAQDVSKFSKGSYTGEVCAKGLKALEVKYILIGHSERRTIFAETDEDLMFKLNNTIENGMTPIYCISGTKEDLLNEINYNNIDKQLSIIPKNVKNIIIAFEPSWLIGTNEVINPELLTNIIKHIKEYMDNLNISHKVIYGGGITKNNFKTISDIVINDGFIMSSSALNLDDFDYIYKELN